MSRISEADKKAMYELAEEILECQRENAERELKGISGDSAKICRLYDLSDSLFCAERVKSLLDELRETQAHNIRLKLALDGYAVTVDTPTRAEIAERAVNLTLHIGGRHGPTT